MLEFCIVSKCFWMFSVMLQWCKFFTLFSWDKEVPSTVLYLQKNTKKCAQLYWDDGITLLSMSWALKSAEEIPIAFQPLDQSIYEKITLFLPLVENALRSLCEGTWSHSAGTHGYAVLGREVPVLCCLLGAKILKRSHSPCDLLMQ